MSSSSSTISIFEIPLILDLICDNLQSKQEIQSCLGVCRLWYSIFQPQLIRYIDFTQLGASQVQRVMDSAHRIRHLSVNISDASQLLESTQCCTNLETLSCVEVETNPFGTSRPSYSSTTTTNSAFRLIERNAGLRTLEVKHSLPRECLLHLSQEEVLCTLSKHQSLTRIKLDIPYFSYYDMWQILRVFENLPHSLQVLDIWSCLAQSPDSILESVDYSKPFRNLRQLSMRNSTYSRICEGGFMNGDVAIKMIASCPQLRVLTLLYAFRSPARLIQTLVRSCPLLERLTLEYQDLFAWQERMAETQIATATATATAAEASAQQVTFNGSFLCLREFHLHGRRRRPTFDESEDLDMMIEFVSRSGPSLEVLRFDVAGNDGTISPKMLSHLSRCVNLRILSFTTDCFVHSYLENGDPSVCLSMLVESRVLEKLTRLRSLNVRISEFAHDLLGYASVILGEHCSEDEDGMWEHRVDYLRNLYDFCRSVKALKNLERLDLRWDKCDIVDVMTVDEMLLFLNKDEFDMARTLEAPITLDDLIRVKFIVP